MNTFSTENTTGIDTNPILLWQSANVLQPMQVRRNATGLNGHQISSDAVHHRLEDGDAAELVDGLVQDQTTTAAQHHRHQNGSPTRVKDLKIQVD